MEDKKTGRPKRDIPDSEQRLLKLQCYVSVDERDRIEAAARAAGFSSVSTFLRVTALRAAERESTVMTTP